MKPYPAETRTTFLQLRARGTSLGAISTQLSVPKSTLSDWDKQLADEISRLRAIEWEAVEEELGRTLEQDLRKMAERIRKWEARIDRMNPDHFDIRQALALVRETRREYFRRRAILMAPLARPSRSSSQHPDESGRFSIPSDPQPLNHNHIQQPPSESSGSTPDIFGGVSYAEKFPSLEIEPTTSPAADAAVTPDERREPASHYAPDAEPASPANQVHNPARTPDQSKIQNPKSKIEEVPPSGGPEDDNVQPSAPTDSFPFAESKIQNPQSKIDSAELTSKPLIPNLRP